MLTMTRQRAARSSASSDLHTSAPRGATMNRRNSAFRFGLTAAGECYMKGVL